MTMFLSLAALEVAKITIPNSHHWKFLQKFGVGVGEIFVKMTFLFQYVMTMPVWHASELITNFTYTFSRGTKCSMNEMKAIFNPLHFYCPFS